MPESRGRCGGGGGMPEVEGGCEKRRWMPVKKMVKESETDLTPPSTPRHSFLQLQHPVRHAAHALHFDPIVKKVQHRIGIRSSWRFAHCFQRHPVHAACVFVPAFMVVAGQVERDWRRAAVGLRRRDRIKNGAVVPGRVRAAHAGPRARLVVRRHDNAVAGGSRLRDLVAQPRQLGLCDAPVPGRGLRVGLPQRVGRQPGRRFCSGRRPRVVLSVARHFGGVEHEQAPARGERRRIVRRRRRRRHAQAGHDVGFGQVQAVVAEHVVGGEGGRLGDG